MLSQTYQNIEILAIDGGSSDNSLKILQKYSNKIIVNSQPNKGLGTALNTGIRKKKDGKFKANSFYKRFDGIRYN